ncbi:uncharacterized protein LOC143267125 [Peromyscus maniculatus bairdii]|uniref:uncharacterized protein LOC143267125 n=1 Tax=Peromyscus maniculatus bairdii TaxID=230844 RepID=UPI003FD0294F
MAAAAREEAVRRPRSAAANATSCVQPASLACSLARGPGRHGHGRQAERPCRQRPHPRLLGLGPALRRRAAAPGAAGRDPRGGEPAAAAAGRTALGRPGSRPRCPAAAAASVPTAPRSRSLGGAVGSAAGGRAAQSAFSIPDGGGAQVGPGMGSAGDCPRPATATERTSTLTARSAPGTAERARYKKDGSGAASPVGAESPRPECYSPPPPPDSAGGTGGSCSGPQTAEDEVPASSPIAGRLRGRRDKPAKPYPRGTPPSPPIDAKDSVETPACREQLNRPVVPHPFKIGDSVWVRRHQSKNLEPRLTGQRLGSTRRM